MRQQSLSNSGFDKYVKKTRKQQFLEEMDIIVPYRFFQDTKAAEGQLPKDLPAVRLQ